TFDGRALYAAKTAASPGQRYLFGWNPTREGFKDYHGWQWGGNLAFHALVQQADGTLRVRPPESVFKAFAQPRTFTFQPGLGESLISSQNVQLTAAESFGCSSAGTLPAAAQIDITITYQAGTRGCGLILHSSEDYESGYYVRLEPEQQRLVFDAWPRPGDQPYMLGLERPLVLSAGQPVRLTVITEGTLGEIYVNDQVAMSVRMYDLAAGNWGVFVQQGSAQFEQFKLHERTADNV
ncbi:MAG: GH32 C-terminal domain-containing protein, partial [Anaerolineae bacterium]